MGVLIYDHGGKKIRPWAHEKKIVRMHLKDNEIRA